MKTDDYLTRSISDTIQQLAKLSLNYTPIQKGLEEAVRTASNMSKTYKLLPMTLVPKVDSALFKTVISSAAMMQNTIHPLLAEISSALTPFYKWISGLDFSAFYFEHEASQDFHDVNEFYMKSMCEARWFPYVGWVTDVKLFDDLLDILYSSRGVSKRAVKRIDNTIMAYYTDREVRKIGDSWKKCKTGKVTKRIMQQAVGAYLRKEYAITSICLSTLWQNLIYEKCGNSSSGRNDKQTKEYYAELIEQNGYSEIFKSYFERFIMYPCYGKESVIPDVPGRNGNAHGWYSSYPKKKAALNAILLTDFILDLKGNISEVA